MRGEESSHTGVNRARKVAFFVATLPVSVLTVLAGIAIERAGGRGRLPPSRLDFEYNEYGHNREWEWWRANYPRLGEASEGDSRRRRSVHPDRRPDE